MSMRGMWWVLLRKARKTRNYISTKHIRNKQDGKASMFWNGRKAVPSGFLVLLSDSYQASKRYG